MLQIENMDIIVEDMQQYIWCTCTGVATLMTVNVCRVVQAEHMLLRGLDVGYI